MTTSRGSTYAKVLKKVQFQFPKRVLTAYRARRCDCPADDRSHACGYRCCEVSLVHTENCARPRWSPKNVDPSGSAAKSRAREDVQQFKTGQKMNILNSAPYFVYLEAGWTAKPRTALWPSPSGKCPALEKDSTGIIRVQGEYTAAYL